MAANTRLPNSVLTEDVNQTTARVVVVVSGLQTSPQGEVQNAEVAVNFNDRGFELQADVDKDSDVVKYRYVVKKLPGDIEPKKCATQFGADRITLLLKKKTEESWNDRLSESGLEQASDSDSD